MTNYNHTWKVLIIIMNLLVILASSCKKDDNISNPPIITKSNIFSISSNAVTIRCVLKNEAGSTISNQGICWSLMPNPTIDNDIVAGYLDDSIMFCRIEELTPKLNHYVRAFVTSGDKTIYGDEIEFTTIDTVSDVEGNVYNTISIGEQVWMVENLKTTKYNDGTDIPFVNENNNWNEINTSAYCWYNNNNENRNLYGALYNWPSVSTGNLCPIGWHVPTDTEWDSLIEYLEGEYNAGGFLKAIDESWNSPNYGATNYAGFCALPGGATNAQVGSFSGKGDIGVWWSSSTYYPIDQNKIWNIYRAMYKENTWVERNGFQSTALAFLSIRCIKN